MQEIILNNLGLIYKAMSDLNCIYFSEDDFEEYYFAGLLGLIKASRTYDETKGKSGYLYTSIKNEIKRVFIWRSWCCRNDSRNNISLNIEINDTELQDLIVSNYDLENEVINKIRVEEMLNKLKNKRYKTFLKEYYGIDTPQLNTQEIAQKYGVSRQFVSNSIKHAISQIRKKEKIK